MDLNQDMSIKVLEKCLMDMNTLFICSCLLMAEDVDGPKIIGEETNPKHLNFSPY